MVLDSVATNYIGSPPPALAFRIASTKVQQYFESTKYFDKFLC